MALIPFFHSALQLCLSNSLQNLVLDDVGTNSDHFILDFFAGVEWISTSCLEVLLQGFITSINPELQQCVEISMVNLFRSIIELVIAMASKGISLSPTEDDGDSN